MRINGVRLSQSWVNDVATTDCGINIVYAALNLVHSAHHQSRGRLQPKRLHIDQRAPQDCTRPLVLTHVSFSSSRYSHSDPLARHRAHVGRVLSHFTLRALHVWHAVLLRWLFAPTSDSGAVLRLLPVRARAGLGCAIGLGEDAVPTISHRVGINKEVTVKQIVAQFTGIRLRTPCTEGLHDSNENARHSFYPATFLHLDVV